MRERGKGIYFWVLDLPVKITPPPLSEGGGMRNKALSVEPPSTHQPTREGVSGAKTPAQKAAWGTPAPGSGWLECTGAGKGTCLAAPYSRPLHASSSGARARPLFCGVSPTTSTSPSLSWPSSLPKENHLYRLPRSARCRARHEDQGAILTRVADPRGRLRVWAAAESAVRADEAADGSGGGN